MATFSILEHFICRAPGMGQKEITTSWKMILLYYLYGYILNTIIMLEEGGGEEDEQNSLS